MENFNSVLTKLADNYKTIYENYSNKDSSNNRDEAFLLELVENVSIISSILESYTDCSHYSSQTVSQLKRMKENIDDNIRYFGNEN